MEIKIQEMADKIAKDHNPEKIILFGSWAWGKPNEESDVDLFIVKETENTRIEAMNIDRSIPFRPFPIDLIVYTPKQFEKWKRLEEPFLAKIINQGKLLYGR